MSEGSIWLRVVRVGLPNKMTSEQTFEGRREPSMWSQGAKAERQVKTGKAEKVPFTCPTLSSDGDGKVNGYIFFFVRSFIYSCIHTFNSYLANTCNVPDMIEAEDTYGNE